MKIITEETMKNRTGTIQILVGLICSLSLPQLAGAGVYWARAIGSAVADEATVVQETSDGGYFVAGNTGFGTTADGWAAKLDSTGKILWQKTYGGSSGDHILSGQQTSDGGYIIAGYTTSFGAGDDDGWVVKLDAWGGVSWQKFYGGSAHDELESLKQTSDNGYICGGLTRSYGGGSNDAWVLKLDSTGGIVWQKAYGSTLSDSLKEIIQTVDGGYLFAGNSTNESRWDTWCVKLTANGDVSWQKAYYDPIHPVSSQAESVLQTSDGGYLIGTILWEGSAAAISCLKIDSGGVAWWWNEYAGSCLDWTRSIRQMSNGDYLVAADTKIYGSGVIDGWLLRLDALGLIIAQQTIGGTGNDAFAQMQLTEDGGLIICGNTTSFGAGSMDAFIIRASSNGITNSTCQYLTTASTAVVTHHGFNGYATSRIAFISGALTGSGSASAVAANFTNTSLCSDAVGIAITSISARRHKPGQIATITGAGFQVFSRRFAVYFGTKKAKPITKASTTSFRVPIPSLPKGWVGVSVRSGIMVSNTFPFEVK